MSKETAVEWLSKRTFIPLHLLDQAKAMEREQIIEAHGIKREHDIQNGVDFWRIKNGEQYYNETYKGGNK